MGSAFGVYFCMYGFRKPYTAAAFADSGVGWLDWKTVLVISQVVGYTLSKFIGIRVVSELPPARRAAAIFTLVLVAEAALVAFALLPRPWSAVMLMLNGLPLGMVFGLVLGFLEGRRLTELFVAGLCASFIVADGATKSVGGWLLANGVSEAWMPAVAGGLFLPPFLASLWMLATIPPPDAGDVAARACRVPLNAGGRRRIFARHAPGLLCVVAIYLLVTVLRSVRADFAREIWTGLTGSSIVPALFTMTELWVAAGVVAATGVLVLVRDNRVALFAALALCGGGLLLALGAAVTVAAGVLPPSIFVVLVGLGVYLPYVAVQVSLFERLLAVSRDRGTSAYLVQLADAFGYLGYVAVLLARAVWGGEAASAAALGRSFPLIVVILSIGGVILTMLACWFFDANLREPVGQHGRQEASPARNVVPAAGSPSALTRRLHCSFFVN